MTDSIVTPLVQPGAFSDLLTDVLRNGAQRLLAHAVEAEVSSFIDAHVSERLDDGRAHTVRHGRMPGARRNRWVFPATGGAPRAGRNF